LEQEPCPEQLFVAFTHDDSLLKHVGRKVPGASLGGWGELDELLCVVDTCGNDEVERVSSSSSDNWRAECECLDSDLADLAVDGTRTIVDS
jgi:hypothetical protein